MAYKTDETGGGSGGVGGGNSLDTACALLAAVIDEVGSQDGICYVATVTDTSCRLGDGFILATIGGSEVHVIDWTLPVSVNSKLIVKKFDNSFASPYVILNYAAPEPSFDTTVPYDVCFPAPMSSPLAEFDCHWGGTILSVTPHGGPTFALTVGGSAVGVGDSVAAGAIVTVTATAATDTLSSVKVVIG